MSELTPVSSDFAAFPLPASLPCGGDGGRVSAPPESAVASEPASSRRLILRPYQDAVVEEFDREVDAGNKRILCVSPTASGKTVIAAAIIDKVVAEFGTVLVLAHRREIVGQTAQKLSAHGVRHGIIQAGTDPRPLERVQVASIQTLHSRAVRSDAMQLPPADLLVIDEAHHCPASTYRRIIDLYPDAILLGLTATPCRGDGRGLGGIFKVIIECPQVAELVAQGYLVKSRVYAPVDPNLKGIRTHAGDYAENQLAERMDKPKLIGDIVTHWHKYGERRKTVCFAVSVAHSIHIRDEFLKSGVRAEHIDGGTPKPERDAILARLESGETELITNCMVLTEGWDMPSVGCCILARPTKKMGLFRQMIGRVLRPAEGKPDAIVLDHSGAVFRHGLPEDRVEWRLDPDYRAEAPAHQARKERRDGGLIECSRCTALRLGGEPCPACGFLPQRPAEYVRFADGDLGLVTNGHAGRNRYDADTKRKWHGELTAVVRQMGKSPGWAYHLYLEKFGEKPPWSWRGIESPPSPEVRSYVRSRQIAFAKGRANVSRASNPPNLTLSSSAVPVGGFYMPKHDGDIPF